ncbi:HIT family protein [Streptomyces griseofuscus]|uniref:HIT family protein n=1 Tax=Streptomyces griseofuscus TaxID=146922 RepID=UPI00368DA44A
MAVPPNTRPHSQPDHHTNGVRQSGSSPPHDVLAATMALVQRVAGAMRTALDASGVNILSASGPGSEQSVPHLHFHVVPRWMGDGISTWPAGRSGHRLSDDPDGKLAAFLAREWHHRS